MATGGDGAGGRRPPWLRKSRSPTDAVVEMERRVGSLGLHTICQSARCPNLGECFGAGVATFLILGNRCTRGCGFCAVEHGGCLEPPDPGEGERIAEFMEAGRIRYAVITSVTRDDLPDGGSGHFSTVARQVKARLPASRLELLVPDFEGSAAAVREVCAAPIDLFGHNVETVPGMYATARPAADYGRSLRVLGLAKEAGRLIKTGIMVGIGESREDLVPLFRDLADIGVDILTIGQYLRPSGRNLPVERYYPPAEFAELELEARASGIAVVVAGPYVRSSYLAESGFLERLKGQGGPIAVAGEKGV